MGITAKDQQIGDLQAKLNEANYSLVDAQQFGLRQEKEVERLTAMVLVLVEAAQKRDDWR